MELNGFLVHKHLANAALRHQIDYVCCAKGYEPIIICTPEELLEA
jgi:hypothetical protein